MMPGPISLRPVRRDDQEFLFSVYSGTRQVEMDATGWAPDERDAFLRSQFELQDRHYKTHFWDAQFSVIEHAGVSVGRIYVHRGPVEISIVEIALLPEHCGAGIGTRLVKDVLAESAQTGQPVTAYVEWGNERSLQFFRRLGFALVGQEGAHFKVEWKPK